MVKLDKNGRKGEFKVITPKDVIYTVLPVISLGLLIFLWYYVSSSAPDMFPTMGRLQLPYVLMHLDGTPATMQDNPQYEDVVTDLLAYFSERMQQARMAGIHDIIVDPGFGFAKTTAQNYRLLAHLDDFRMLQAPVLAGMSRKSMLYKLLDCTPDDALNATTAANMLALMKGVAILRVHDVKEAVESVKIFKQFKYFGENNPDEARLQA